jgi:hypothetical protein
MGGAKAASRGQETRRRLGPRQSALDLRKNRIPAATDDADRIHLRNERTARRDRGIPARGSIRRSALTGRWSSVAAKAASCSHRKKRYIGRDVVKP